ncbi:hypothetical protein BJY24_007352 [Nocardia transvalensis]|uniref:Uncharacterized protein n=1 Tax=Nocardia transvalensis TaxID=37333 RepID=A0A7W9PLM7_9NOCA|nr:hypothetical protein [Nocardia transvalensis]MBB5918440.1 hypothetical protein [Nocardia transvalensis]
MTNKVPSLPNAKQLHRAFRGEVEAIEPVKILDAAARMVPVYDKRKKAVRTMREQDGVASDELRRAVGDFITAEVSLAALAMTIDRNVSEVLRGRDHVSGVWHTETVGLVVSRMAELWLNYLDNQSHEDAYWVARMSDAYNFLVAELTTGRRLPPDM